MGKTKEKKITVSTNGLLMIIKRHCIECGGGDRESVEKCTLKNCDLWKYRNLYKRG